MRFIVFFVASAARGKNDAKKHRQRGLESGFHAGNGMPSMNNAQFTTVGVRTLRQLLRFSMESAESDMDKVFHFTAGSLAALLAAALASWLGSPVPLAFGAGAALAAGIAKEAHDDYQNDRARELGQPPLHDVDFADGVVTWCGGGFGLAVAVVLFGWRA